MSVFSPATHVLLKVNYFPHRSLTHSCHMISSIWIPALREWQLANNDAKWVSTKRVVIEDKEKDVIHNLMHNLEGAYSITLYHF